MSRVFAILAALIMLGTMPCTATQADRVLKGPAVGGSVDRFLYEGEGVTALSFRFSDLRPHTVGSEVGISLFPAAVGYGALLLAPDLGAAFNASGQNVTLLAKGGLSTLLGLGGGFAFYPGFHLGAGFIIRAGERFGLRMDVVRHTYLGGEESASLWSIGLGFTSLPRRAVAAPATSVKESGGR